MAAQGSMAFCREVNSYDDDDDEFEQATKTEQLLRGSPALNQWG